MLLATLSVAAAVLVSPQPDYADAHVDNLQKGFEKAFSDRCPKYPFVELWRRLVENPGDRYVVFVWDEPELKNGGVGDRLAGLTTAMGIALRTNRTLLIETHRGFDKLFRPYHPTNAFGNGDGRYTYKMDDWSKWTKYDPFQAYNDTYDFKLPAAKVIKGQKFTTTHCIVQIANPGHMDVCGMDTGDIAEKYIKVRGNRAHICKWAKNPSLQAHKELMENVMQMKPGEDALLVNWFEVAGCMLRLALWPTPYLWETVRAELKSRIHKSMGSNGVALGGLNTVQIGAHFRCGDQSFKSYLGHTQEDLKQQCTHNPNITTIKGFYLDIEDPNWRSLSECDDCPESLYMTGGTPDGLGKCVGKLVHNYTMNHVASGTDKQAVVSAAVSTVLYVTSDNIYSTEQLNEYAHKFSQATQSLEATNPNLVTITGPAKTCHVEFDPTFECFKETMTEWLILSASDDIVTQTDMVQSPISGYSRYAAMYGLKGDSLRDGKACTKGQSFHDMGLIESQNWLCDWGKFSKKHPKHKRLKHMAALGRSRKESDKGSEIKKSGSNSGGKTEAVMPLSPVEQQAQTQSQRNAQTLPKAQPLAPVLNVTDIMDF